MSFSRSKYATVSESVDALRKQVNEDLAKRTKEVEVARTEYVKAIDNILSFLLSKYDLYYSADNQKYEKVGSLDFLKNKKQTTSEKLDVYVGKIMLFNKGAKVNDTKENLFIIDDKKTPNVGEINFKKMSQSIDDYMMEIKFQQHFTFSIVREPESKFNRVFQSPSFIEKDNKDAKQAFEFLEFLQKDALIKEFQGIKKQEGGYYAKYMKYKNKYIQLKNRG